MKIAIINFEEYEKLQDTLENLQYIHKDVIDAKIDLFCNDKVALDERLKENLEIRNIYPQKTDDLNLLNIQGKYKSLRYYTKLNSYNIALDTQGSLLSSIVTYLLAGNTGGFIKQSFYNKITSKLYDERTHYDPNDNKKSIYNLFSKTFGFESPI